MASRRFDPLTVIGEKRVAITGKVFTNGSSNPATTVGKGYTITRTTTGTYAIVFSDIFNAFEGAFASVQATSGWAGVTIGDWVASTRTLTVRTYTESAGTIAAADIAADANNSFSFMALFKNTSA
jgi:hypothetical protein